MKTELLFDKLVDANFNPLKSNTKVVILDEPSAKEDIKDHNNIKKVKHNNTRLSWNTSINLPS